MLRLLALLLTLAASAHGSRNYTEIKGGDCCPGTTACKPHPTSPGPFAVSTGGDYPSISSKLCDQVVGCVAFGQMYSYVEEKTGPFSFCCSG
jgi:hypothetical protein